jgi:hypothetical protein
MPILDRRSTSYLRPNPAQFKDGGSPQSSVDLGFPADFPYMGQARHIVGMKADA